MLVKDVIDNKGSAVVTVSEDASIMDATQIMKSHGIGALIVVTPSGALHGVVSEREIVSAVACYGAGVAETLVRDVMLVDSPVVAPTDRVIDAMKQMTEERVRHLPVISGRSVVGLLSIGDAVKARLSEKIAENLVLQDMARWPNAMVA